MSRKYNLRVVKDGRLQEIKVFAAGDGVIGKPLVLKAMEASRYLLTDPVLNNSPAKVQIQRVGKHLHLALPGGDIEAPDLVIENYFDTVEVSLSGMRGEGNWLRYDLSALNTQGAEVGESKSISIDLGSGQGGWLEWFDSPKGLLAIGGGALALSALGGGGESDGTVNSTAAIDVLRAFAADTSNPRSAARPTLGQYSEAGVKMYASLTDTSEGSRITLTGSGFGFSGASADESLLRALNSGLSAMGSSDLSTAKIQAMVDSYYRIMREANGDATINVDVYNDSVRDVANLALNDPKASDYTAVGVTVNDDVKPMELLNNVVGRLSVGQVDSLEELNALATVVHNIMVQAGMSVGTGNPVVYTTDAQWVSGLSSLGFMGISIDTISEIKSRIAATADDGSGVDTWQEVSDLISPLVALQLLKVYANATGGAGATPPTLQTYKSAGIKGLSSLSAVAAAEDIDSAVVITALGVDASAWLAALNSALAKLSGDATLTTSRLQAMVNSYYRVLSEADGVSNTTNNVDVYPNDSNNNPLSSDYANLGVTIGGAKSVDLLSDSVGQLTKAAVNHTDKLNALAKAAHNVMVQAGLAITNGAPALYATSDAWIPGLNQLLGLTTATGVNVDNVEAVKSSILATAGQGTPGDGLEVDTVQELLAIVSLARLKSYTVDGANPKTAPTPTLADWGSVVKANTSLSDNAAVDVNTATYWRNTNPVNGLAALNSALDTLSGDQTTVGTTGTLQRIVDSFGRILQEANGSRASNVDVSRVAISAGLSSADVVVQDLLNVGVKSGQNNGSGSTGTGLNYLGTGTLLASAIGSVFSTSVDTVAELDGLADIAQNIMKQAAGESVTYTDTDWATNLGRLGITGATVNNVDDIKLRIATTADDGTGIDSYDELQGLVSLVRINDYAAQNTGFVAPVLIDYQAIMAITGSDYTAPTTAALNAYNDVVNAKPISNFTAAEIKDIVINYNVLFNAADGNGLSTTPTFVATDYAKLGVVVDGYGGMAIAKTEELLNQSISRLTASAIDSVAELQRLEDVIGKIFTLASSTKTSGASQADFSGGPTQFELGLLGFRGVDDVALTQNNMTSAELSKFYEFVIYSDHTRTSAEAYRFTELQNWINDAIRIV